MFITKCLLRMYTYYFHYIDILFRLNFCQIVDDRKPFKKQRDVMHIICYTKTTLFSSCQLNQTCNRYFHWKRK